jgi:O-antigen/teichoic acid export membrane protein
MHARDETERERSLFLGGGKVCLVLVLLFVSLFLFLGKPLIRLWMGPALESAYPLLLILAIGEVLPMSQWITYSMILGKGRHRALAGFSLLELLGSGIAALCVAGTYGLPGVCLAVAMPAAALRGVCQLAFGCSLIDVSSWTYVRLALLPAIAIGAGPAALLGLATLGWQPASWPGLFLIGGAYTSLYLAVAGVTLVGVERLRGLAGRLRGDRTEAGPANRE